MFLGQYAHNLDAKGRLTIPAIFRAPLDDGLYVTSGEDRCLVVYTPGEWEELATRVGMLPKASQEARAYSRLVFGRAHEAKLDAMGRLLLPIFLREHAGIENEALVVGVNSRIEIWSPQNWEMALERASQDLDAILAKVADMGV